MRISDWSSDVCSSDLLYWHAFVLRDHLWHGHDFSRRMAVIRLLEDAAAAPPNGMQQRSWGGAAGRAYRTGPAFALGIAATTEQQLAWLRRVDRKSTRLNSSH